MPWASAGISTHAVHINSCSHIHLTKKKLKRLKISELLPHTELKATLGIPRALKRSVSKDALRGGSLCRLGPCSLPIFGVISTAHLRPNKLTPAESRVPLLFCFVLVFGDKQTNRKTQPASKQRQVRLLATSHTGHTLVGQILQVTMTRSYCEMASLFSNYLLADSSLCHFVSINK